jgi:hypothetical protein
VSVITSASIRDAAQRLGLVDAERLMDGKAPSPTAQFILSRLAEPRTQYVVQLQAVRAVHAYDLSPGKQREQALRSAGVPDTLEATSLLLTYGGLLRETVDDRLHRRPLRDRRYVPSFPATEATFGTSWTAGAKERSRLLKKLSKNLPKGNSDSEAAAVLLQILESPYLKARLRSAGLYGQAQRLWSFAYPRPKIVRSSEARDAQPDLSNEVAALCAKLSAVHEQRGVQHSAALHAFEVETRDFFERVVGGRATVNRNASTKTPLAEAKAEYPQHQHGWYFAASYYLACSVFPHLHDQDGQKAWLHIVSQRGKQRGPDDYRALYLQDRLFSTARNHTLPWLRPTYPACARRKATWKEFPGPWDVLARHLTFYDPAS